MKLRFSVDAIEGRLCRLINVDDPAFIVDWPKAALPRNIKQGTIISMEARKDRTATKQAEEHVKALIGELLDRD